MMSPPSFQNHPSKLPDASLSTHPKEDNGESSGSFLQDKLTPEMLDLHSKLGTTTEVYTDSHLNKKGTPTGIDWKASIMHVLKELKIDTSKYNSIADQDSLTKTLTEDIAFKMASAATSLGPDVAALKTVMHEIRSAAHTLTPLVGKIGVLIEGGSNVREVQKVVMNPVSSPAVNEIPLILEGIRKLGRHYHHESRSLRLALDKWGDNMKEVLIAQSKLPNDDFESLKNAAIQVLRKSH